MTDAGCGGGFGSAVLRRVGDVSRRVQERTPLRADVLESDEEYLVVLDAPGAEARDVEVTTEGGAVRVRIERVRGFYDEFDALAEGRATTLTGRVELPDGAIADAADARAKLNDDGTIYVFLPKAEPIRIESGGADDDGSAADA